MKDIVCSTFNRQKQIEVFITIYLHYISLLSESAMQSFILPSVLNTACKQYVGNCFNVLFDASLRGKSTGRYFTQFNNKL